MNSLLRSASSRICCNSSCLWLATSSPTSPILSKISSVASYTNKNHLAVRQLSHSSSRSAASAEAVKQTIDHQRPERHVTEDPFVYHGPLTSAFRRLKLFSLGSFGLSVTLSPFIFIIDSAIPMNARIALAGIALGTSGLSTTLVAWCAKPYVTEMHRFRPDGAGSAEEVEMTTYTLALQPRFTKVYDPSFLIETRRPLAKWELAHCISLTRNRTEAVGTNVHPSPGQEETVAETRNSKDEVLGRWIVKWEEGGAGTCHEVGHVVRHFNVHEELLK